MQVHTSRCPNSCQHKLGVSSWFASDVFLCHAVICNDQEVTTAARVLPMEDSLEFPSANVRRLQTTTSEAGVAHKARDFQDGMDSSEHPLLK